MTIIVLTHALAASAGALGLYGFLHGKLKHLKRDPKTGRFTK